ncbi:MAG: hypothetical protein IPJ88_06150 [Myxococcales bacterium]|nr:MAG: hypothetical protein IPJ88_06150 [Myxococcales bacterium]
MALSRIGIILCWSILSLCLPSCSSDKTNNSGITNWNAEELYSEQTQRIVIEVDYQTGAEPYTTGGAFSGDPWDLFELNLKALFNYTTSELVVPKTLSDMEELTDITDDKFTLEEIAAIAQKHQDTPNTDSQRVIYIVFLDGYSEDDQGNQEEILGLSIRNTNIVAVFKPIIKTRSALYPELAEQINVIHEVGHAVGLVNSGISMSEDHLDTQQYSGKSHCDNRDCIMYFEFEMNDNVDDRLGEILQRNSQVLFGDECLIDTEEAAGFFR